MKTEKIVPVWQYVWRIYAFLPWRYLFFLLIILGSWLFSIPLGLLPSQFFDTLTGVQPSPWGVWGLIALLGGFEVVRALCNFGWGVMGVNTEYRVRALLQRNLMQQILEVPAIRVLPFSTGETVNRLRDDVNALTGLLTSWQAFLSMCCFALVGLILMARISPSITLLVFLPLVLILIVMNRLRPKIEAYRARSRQTTGDTTGALSELFHAVQAIKVARAEERMVEHFAEISEQRQRASLQDLLFKNGLDALFGYTTELGVGLILIFASTAMRAGTFTIGSFALFVFYLDYLPWIMGSIANLLPEYRRVGVSAERLQLLLRDAPPQQLVQHHRHLLEAEQMPVTEQVPPVTEPLQVLDVRNLSFTYPTALNSNSPDTDASGQSGIKDISFRLERGKCLVITGQIGMGKTTLLRTVLGLLPKQEGEICWNGKPIHDPATFFVPPRSAYTAQIPRLFRTTLRDNILLGLDEAHVDLEDALRNAVLADEFATLDIVLGPRGTRLSGGQIQRTAAARMFVRKAELLVFDDLSSALDVETETTLWQRLFVAEHPTLLIVSHRREVLRYADHILVLHNGGIEAEGTLAELLPKNETVQSIWYQTQPTTAGQMGIQN
ncbi:MAG: ABC transporter ATP-binding protein [Chloroflexota bacterium]